MTELRTRNSTAQQYIRTTPTHPATQARNNPTPEVTAMSVATLAPRRLHVTTRPVIDSEPPYEREEIAPDTAPRVIGSLALATAAPVLDPAPADLPEPVPARRLLELVPAHIETLLDHRIDDLFDVVRTPRAELPAPGPRAAVLVGAIMEALGGRRPLTQLVRWLTTDVYDELEVNVTRGSSWTSRLCRLMVSEPADGVAEVTAIVQRGQRATALALRLEGRDGRWVVTALETV